MACVALEVLEEATPNPVELLLCLPDPVEVQMSRSLLSYYEEKKKRSFNSLQWALPFPFRSDAFTVFFRLRLGLSSGTSSGSSTVGTA